MIRKIRIRNFRSIVDQTISTEEISILVGNNDAGKSNVLRALNLFFNGETDHNQKFDFESDFSLLAKTGASQAKEVSIELILKLPASYRGRDVEKKDQVYWKKVWRAEGELKRGSEMCYADSRKNKIPVKGKQFEKNKKISNLLENIKFFYVPAIKDRAFFLELQGKMYDAMSESYGSTLHSSASAFQSTINSEFELLLKGLNASFSTKNEIALPRNLRSVFENLEIRSEGVPLNRRGDGVKVRHIPSMLRYIKNGYSSGRRKIICPHIWGFEEPENNVEFVACYKLREELIEAAKDKIQIFLTTHSPVIYTLPNEIEPDLKVKVSRHYVERVAGESLIDNADDGAIHHAVGFMSLISPIIEMESIKYKEQTKNIEDQMRALEKQFEINRLPKIFVEGKSDKAILFKVMKVYCPDLIGKVDISLDDSGSANTASDRAKAHYLINKHRGDSFIKAILLLDGDNAGSDAAADFNSFVKDQSKKKIVETIKIEPKAAVALIKKGFNVQKCIEAYFPECVWKHAYKQSGWLKEIPVVERFTRNQINKIINNGFSTSDLLGNLKGVDDFLVKYKVEHPGKEGMSKFVENIDDNKFREEGYFQELYDEVFVKIKNFFEIEK